MRSGWGPQRRFSAKYAQSCALRAKSSENVWAEEPSGGRAGGQLLRPSQKSLEVVQFVSTDRSKFYPVRCICSSIICHRLFCEIQFVGYFWFSGTYLLAISPFFHFFWKILEAGQTCSPTVFNEMYQIGSALTLSITWLFCKRCLSAKFCAELTSKFEIFVRFDMIKNRCIV